MDIMFGGKIVCVCGYGEVNPLIIALIGVERGA